MVITQEQLVQMIRKCFEENFYICPYSKAILLNNRLPDPKHKSKVEERLKGIINVSK